MMDSRNLQGGSMIALTAELEELRTLMLLHEASIRSTSVGQFEWDYGENRLGYCSKGYAEIFNQSVAEVTEAQNTWDRFFECIHPNDRDSYLKACGKRHAQGNVFCEFRIVLRDGEIRHLQETNIYNRSNAKVVRGNFGIVRDVTLQKKAEGLLDSNERIPESLLGLEDMGMFLYDEITERFLYSNEVMADLYGVQQDYLLENIRSESEDFEFVFAEDRQTLSNAYTDTEMGDIWEVEYRMVRSDGEVLWVREMGKSFLVQNGIEEQSIGVVLDISDRKQTEIALTKANENLEHEVAERTRDLDRTIRLLESEVETRKLIAAKLQHLANHDPLTGLPAIRLCMDRLSHALSIADRQRDSCVVMFLDIDGFKAINDSHGHWQGDEALKIIAARLDAIVRDADTVARIGGDEFIVILSGVSDPEIIEQIAVKLIKETSRAIHTEVGELHVGLSIGIARYPRDGANADELIRAADAAMYRVKRNGKSHFKYAES